MKQGYYTTLGRIAFEIPKFYFQIRKLLITCNHILFLVLCNIILIFFKAF